MGGLPNLMIVGVPRAGTTSLFSYLADHGDVCGASVKEPNYFLPAVHGRPLGPLAEYAALFGDAAPACRYRLEASPRYFYGKGELARRIQAVVGPDFRAVIILREPAARLHSFFSHRKKMGELDWGVSYEAYVRRALSDLGDVAPRLADPRANLYLSDVRDDGLAQGIYWHFLPGWLEVMGDRVKVLFFEHLSRTPFATMQDLCEWLGLDWSVYANRDFTAENRTVAFRSRGLLRLARMVNDLVFHRLFPNSPRLKALLVRAHGRLNRSSSPQPATDPATEAALRAFYRPHNAELRRILTGQSLPDWVTGA